MAEEVVRLICAGARGRGWPGDVVLGCRAELPVGTTVDAVLEPPPARELQPSDQCRPRQRTHLLPSGAPSCPRVLRPPAWRWAMTDIDHVVPPADGRRVKAGSSSGGSPREGDSGTHGSRACCRVSASPIPPRSPRFGCRSSAGLCGRALSVVVVSGRCRLSVVGGGRRWLGGECAEHRRRPFFGGPLGGACGVPFGLGHPHIGA